MRDALDRALGETPPSFARRMDQTLLQLKEESQVKPMKLRTILVFAILALLACTTAFALVTQGLDWYYSNRFTAYQEHQPEKYDALMQGRQTNVIQTTPDDPDIRIMVTEAAWAAEQKTLVVSVSAWARSGETALHPLHNLDLDGAYVGEGSAVDPAEDGVDRAVHWLWTTAGFGPVEEMIPEEKTLLLLSTGRVYLAGERLLGDGSSYDVFVTEDGAVQTVIELRLDDAVLQTLRAHAGAEGIVTLTIPYTVTLYTDDDAALYGGGRAGEITFEVKIN